jgi:transcriptional regulator with XRE-family HTH domain
MDLQQIFSQNMRKYRKKAGLTLKDLADFCDCNFRYLSQIETRERCPSLALIEKIALGLGVEPALLFIAENPSPGGPPGEANISHALQRMAELIAELQAVKEEIEQASNFSPL